jgi:hypothetical protein
VVVFEYLKMCLVIDRVYIVEYASITSEPSGFHPDAGCGIHRRDILRESWYAF